MNDTAARKVDMTKEQMTMWLALEGWVPWVADGDKGRPYWGVRSDLRYACRIYGECYHAEATLAQVNKEYPCGWSDIPDLDMTEIYNEVIRGFY